MRDARIPSWPQWAGNQNAQGCDPKIETMLNRKSRRPTLESEILKYKGRTWLEWRDEENIQCFRSSRFGELN